MSMPTLDPSRYFAAILADPSHKLPLPDRGGRLFLKDGEVIDSADPFYAHLLADGSLVRKRDDEPERADAPQKDDLADKPNASDPDPKPPTPPLPPKADPKA